MQKREHLLKNLADKIHRAESIILTTHKMSDGDGLGCILSLYHALKKIGKPVRAISVDKIPKKYHFLSTEKYIENFENLKNPIEPTELVLVCDTNDYRRLQPLYAELQQKCQEVIYIDHHPLLHTVPAPPKDSIIDISAASTGEICYFLLKKMNIEMDPDIATAIYTSIVFDTQRFQFTKNSATSHKICAELCSYIDNNERIYYELFGITSLEKMNLFSETIKQTEYFYEDKVAVMEISTEELNKHNLSIEDACDLVDMSLEVNTTQLSVLIVHLPDNKYKLSFRSKKWDVSKLAETFNGGGHKNASGAVLVDYQKKPKEEILTAVNKFFSLN